MKKMYSILGIVLLLLPSSGPAQAQATSTESVAAPVALSGKLEVVPNIIDDKAKARDILRYELILKNNSERSISAYAMVNDISATEGQQEFGEPGRLDRKTSLASWISISRGVSDIRAGEEISIPLEIKVDLTAIPGKRFAQISFPGGSSRYEAEAKVNNPETPKVFVNISVEEEIVERAQVKNFATAKNVYTSFPVDFTIALENFGNRQITPQGAIIIFNRRGEEVASLDLNSASTQIEPGQMETIVSNWSDGRGFGKFKAKLEIEYGSKDKRDLQDTVYFWVFPWLMLLIFFLAIFFLIVIITVLIFKRTFHHAAHQHHGQPAIHPHEADGVINLRKH